MVLTGGGGKDEAIVVVLCYSVGVEVVFRVEGPISTL